MYTQKYVYIYMHVCAHIHIIYDIISGVGPEVADLGFSRSRTGFETGDWKSGCENERRPAVSAGDNWGTQLVGGIFCLYCDLQQGPYQHPWFHICYNFDELASSGNILFPSCGIMDEIV
nr:hypothetical protein Iba_scaffold61624CG0010 [Ipomoea batatas]GMD28216.1 hypothetical protein Iba_chr08eCG5240 [Ipomoea batatas]